MHAPLAHRRLHVVEADAALVEVDRAVDGVERVRQREVPDAAVGDRRAAREERIAQRAVDGGRELRTARSAHVAEETLQDPQVGVARRLQRDLLIVQPDRPRHAQLGAVAHQLQLVHSDDALIEREVNRRGVLQRVVEHPNVERVHGDVDDQVIDVRELADDADRAARDGGVERRQTRLVQAHVRIERAVVELERHLRVRLRRQRDPSGAVHRKARRHGSHVAAQLLAAQRQRAGDLADAFLADEQSAGALFFSIWIPSSRMPAPSNRSDAVAF